MNTFAKNPVLFDAVLLLVWTMFTVASVMTASKVGGMSFGVGTAFSLMVFASYPWFRSWIEKSIPNYALLAMRITAVSILSYAFSFLALGMINNWQEWRQGLMFSIFTFAYMLAMSLAAYSISAFICKVFWQHYA